MEVNADQPTHWVCPECGRAVAVNLENRAGPLYCDDVEFAPVRQSKHSVKMLACTLTTDESDLVERIGQVLHPPEWTG